MTNTKYFGDSHRQPEPFPWWLWMTAAAIWLAAIVWWVAS